MIQKKRYKLTLSYDGTHYSGWQVQSNGISIQSLVQKSLETALRHPIDLTGSGRTDAGVHARGQTAHFDTSASFPLPRLLLSLNALLPPDIRVLRIDEVSPTFHARYTATGKTYHYHLHLDRIADPFTLPYCFHVYDRLTLEDLRRATPLFLGTRDFTSFANEAHRGSASHDPIRTLRRFDVVEQPGGLRLELEADGFLYKMVRNLVGTLLEVARGKIAPADVEAIFAARDRRRAGPAVPPHALFLMQVNY
ncbi:MAG: tRNA pseudouridine(38-40) synthase TruA [Verrucomicrobiota bacterium]|nr:tRNA pseudouridine(38-40) synthase TruA [Verrucomicrobiota bacterium]